MFVSRTTYDKVVEENNKLATENQSLKIELAVAQAENQLLSESSIDKNFVVQKINDLYLNLSKSAFKVETEQPLTDAEKLESRKEQVEQEINLLLNTPAVIQRDFRHRREELTRLEKERQQINNDLAKAESQK